ncbi:cytosine permease [Brevibacterium sp. 50QC2O2]|uniref:purine-cytosine permease family protein n=1 Tax=Brevibacterium sp. 50QC2O2 TaxID=2968459 RepID=UPI00211B94BD|nr:cytosine permease [Brevibacterium sp. 50QC2O2]MCQ9388478.1 cytosine permease [Brevibacterium sp. 50QC2O2]
MASSNPPESISTDDFDSDYADTPVPDRARKHWFPIAVTKFGQVSALSQFLLGSTLGFGMPFWKAFVAITLGSVILQVVSIMVGIIGMRTGLTTSILTRWTGFGRGGAAVVGAVIAISSIGWFGIQSGVSAEGLASTVGVMPEWLWALLFGFAITVVVVFGFKMIARVAYIAVPLFLVLALAAAAIELSRHSFGELLTSAPPGPEMNLVQGTGLVAGGFIVGAVINSDITRYNRSSADVVKQTVLGITLGEYLIGLIGVLLAHAVGSADVTTIILSSVGWIGVLVIIMGTIKINDINLYSSVFGIINFIAAIFGRNADRKTVTITVGVLGSVLGAAGILDHFTTFLSVLGVLMPPVAAIMVAEYFIVKKWRGEIDVAHTERLVPATQPNWIPLTLIIWAIASAVGFFVTWGIPAINSLVVAFVLYVAAGKLGWIKEYGRSDTPERVRR